MELVKENVTVNQVSCKGDTQVLVDEDIIVPDVKPDILKILQLDAVSCITNKEITNGRVNVTGRVDLKILYIPDSDREKIKSIIIKWINDKNKRLKGAFKWLQICTVIQKCRTDR